MFLAHWCPHCQAEVPRLVSLAKGAQIAGVDLVGIPTNTTDQAPNYPSPVTNGLGTNGQAGGHAQGMPDCTGLSTVACIAALQAAGFLGTVTTVVLDTAGADAQLTYSASAAGTYYVTVTERNLGDVPLAGDGRNLPDVASHPYTLTVTSP